MIVHTDSITMELLGKKILFFRMAMTLGKRFWLPAYQAIFFHNSLVQWAFAKIHPDLSFRMAHYWSKSRLSYKNGDARVKILRQKSKYLFAKSVEGPKRTF